MDLSDLITKITPVTLSFHGVVYTHGHLGDNPDVCHALCLYFLQNLKNGNISSLIHELASVPHSRFMKAQSDIVRGPSMPKAIISMGKREDFSDEDIESLNYMNDFWKQPKSSNLNSEAFSLSIQAELLTHSDKIMVYMSREQEGHVICVCRYVAGFILYDSNFGIVSLPFKERDIWRSIVKCIIDWYFKNMGLHELAFKSFDTY